MSRPTLLRPILLSAIVCGLSAGITRGDAIDHLIQETMAKRKIPALSLAVVKDGSVVKVHGYGLCNLECNAVASPDTVYELGSITKQFTATAILMLLEDGKLALTDKVTSLLPDLPSAWGDVTVRHLLTHTSGIKSYTGVGNFEEMARSDYKPGEILKLVSAAPLEFKPGESWAYNNTGYYLLGLIVEKTSGKSYADFLEERIFEPLGMNATRSNDPRAIVPNRARGYARAGNVLQNRDGLTPTSAFSAGNLISTVRDMAKWADALDQGKFLTSENYKAMYTPVEIKGGEHKPYGFGWGISSTRGHKVYSHGGGTAGFSTMITRFPDDRLTIIVLTNLAGADADLSRQIAGHYLPDLAKPNVAKPEDPELTKKNRAILATVLEGKPDSKDFTDGFAKFLDSEAAKAMTRALNAAGTVKEFRYLESEDDGDSHVLRYQMKIGDRTLVAIFQIGGDGKIAGIALKPE